MDSGPYVFRDLDQFEPGSRNERPMTRYFPELVAGVTAELPERCVIDGEVVIATDHGVDFEALQQRIHSANSRVRMLVEQMPASFIAFDLLALSNDKRRRSPAGARSWTSYSTCSRPTTTTVLSCNALPIANHSSDLPAGRRAAGNRAVAPTSTDLHAVVRMPPGASTHWDD